MVLICLKTRSPYNELRRRQSGRKSSSHRQPTELNEPYIAMSNGAPVHLTTKLTRAKLESLVDDLIANSIKPCEVALADAGSKLQILKMWFSWWNDSYAEGPGCC